MLEKVPEESVLIFCLGFDSSADCQLVWQPMKSEGIHAISAPGSKGERLGGSYIAFVPSQKADYGVIFEDGFIVMLTNQSWTILRKCLVTGVSIIYFFSFLIFLCFFLFFLPVSILKEQKNEHFFCLGTKAVVLSDTEEGLNLEVSFFEKVPNTMYTSLSASHYF